jgi:zinc protease
MQPPKLARRATPVHWCVRLTLTATVLLGSATSASAQRATFTEMMRDTTLENGLQVVVLPNPTVPLVTVQVTIRNGAFTQLTEGEEGVPHILEHILFKAYGGSGFSEAANKLNAYYNGTTSDETVTYHMTLPASNLDAGVKLLADLMRAPRFDRFELRDEKNVVRGELERLASDPEFVLSTMVDQKLWGAGFGRKNTIGNMVTIMSSTADQLKRTYERFYLPNNAAVVFTGDVTAAAAFGSASKHMVRWRRGEDPFRSLELPPMPALAASEAITVPIETNDVTLLVRWHGPSVRTDPGATYAADVFSAIINDPASDFQTRLVDSGLFQSVSMGYLTRAHTGPVTLRATTTADQLVEASAALRREIDRFPERDYVTPEILAIAKKREAVNWAMAMETPSGLASFIGDLWSVADLDYARGYIDAMQAQSADDIARYVATYVSGKPRVTGIMVSPATRHELGARLPAALAPWRN